MKVLIDTNVILDVLIGREPHLYASAAFLKLCGTKVTGFITANQTTDIFYLLRRDGKTPTESKTIIKKLTDQIKIMDVNAIDVNNALDAGMPDYEDALLAYRAKRQNARYIVTRNGTDYTKSPVAAISPQSFLDKILPITQPSSR